MFNKNLKSDCENNPLKIQKRTSYKIYGYQILEFYESSQERKISDLLENTN